MPLRVLLLNCFGHNEDNSRIMHLVKLASGDATLSCENVLDRNLRRFAQNLPPAILACGLDADSKEPFAWKPRVVIRGLARNDDIRPRTVDDPSHLEPEPRCNEELFHVILQRSSCSRLSRLHQLRSGLQEVVDILEQSNYVVLGEVMFDHPKQSELFGQPPHELIVRRSPGEGSNASSYGTSRR